MKLAAALSATALIGSVALTTPAWAAAPGNDAPGGATPVSLGDHITQDTTEATTDATDAEVNTGCGAPATDASVWYSYTAAVDGGVIIDGSASDYPAGFLVFEGTPAADSLVTCGPGTVGLSASAGTTYTIMAIDDGSDGTPGVGGNLVLDVTEAPPAPTVDLNVDPTAKVDRYGNVLVTGSYSCTDGEFVEISAQLTQTVGRLKINGYGFTFEEGTCDGASHPFTMPIVGDNGKFAGGKAASISFAYACGAFECAEGYNEQTIRLSKGK